MNVFCLDNNNCMSFGASAVLIVTTAMMIASADCITPETRMDDEYCRVVWCSCVVLGTHRRVGGMALARRIYCDNCIVV